MRGRYIKRAILRQGNLNKILGLFKLFPQALKGFLEVDFVVEEEDPQAF